ncbi:MAG TPA: ATP-binding protein [Anaerolineae bacterium]|nr:ATP-binding protein [Anaerolineae bacterium]
MPKQSLKAAAYRCDTCALCAGEQIYVIKSEPVNLSVVRNHIRQIGEHCDLSEKQLFDLQVAVGEATANAIEHGSPLGIENTVGVAVSCDKGSLTIVVKDEGKFKRRMPNPGVGMNFRGRGIPLMLALMDRVTIDEAKDGTQVILVKQVSNGTYNCGEQGI